MSTCLFLAALLPLFAAETPLVRPTRAVKTSNGSVQGYIDHASGIQTFKGVRYAAPPVGPLRFLPPQRPKPWREVHDAMDFGAPCMQMAGGAVAYPFTEFGRQLSAIFPTPQEMKIDNEDCLFLNLWTPGLDGGKKRPVMVWFHGGGFAYGSGNWPVYDGTNLAKKGDVVLITVTHRLNVFGYLHLAEFGGEKYQTSGNAGLLDLVMALEWVRDNAAAFGGDPGNVTILGESGGGFKVSALCAMPAAKGLFHRAVIQSGPGLRANPKEAAVESTNAIMKKLGIAKGDLKALQAVPPDDLLAAAASTPAARLSPVVDGVSLPTDPFTPAAPELSANVPILIGTNKDEMTIFNAAQPWFLTGLKEEELQARVKQAHPKGAELLEVYRKLHPDYTAPYLLSAVMTGAGIFGGSVTLAERKAAQKAAPVYMYMLVWNTPVMGGILKSPHTLEMPLMFANVDKSRVLVGPGAAPEAIAARMSDAWLAFARTGNPNVGGSTEWPPYDPSTRAVMLFDERSRVEMDPYGEIRKLLASQ